MSLHSHHVQRFKQAWTFQTSLSMKEHPPNEKYNILFTFYPTESEEFLYF